MECSEPWWAWCFCASLVHNYMKSLICTKIFWNALTINQFILNSNQVHFVILAKQWEENKKGCIWIHCLQVTARKSDMNQLIFNKFKTTSIWSLFYIPRNRYRLGVLLYAGSMKSPKQTGTLQARLRRWYFCFRFSNLDHGLTAYGLKVDILHR